MKQYFQVVDRRDITYHRNTFELKYDWGKTVVGTCNGSSALFDRSSTVFEPYCKSCYTELKEDNKVSIRVENKSVVIEGKYECPNAKCPTHKELAGLTTAAL
jgi:hypothetical protein